MPRPEVFVGRPAAGASMGQIFYGVQIAFFPTNDGMRASFEYALDLEKTIWQRGSEQYAPDSTADPESVGATVSASGISLPAGSMTAAKPSEAQRWVWKLDGTGNIPLALDVSSKGTLSVDFEAVSWSAHDDALCGVWLGNAAPTASAAGIAAALSQGSAGVYGAEISRSDTGWISLGTNATMKYANMIANYSLSGSNVFLSDHVFGFYLSDYSQNKDSASTSNIDFDTPAIAIFSGHDSAAVATVVVDLVVRLQWTVGA